MFLSKDGNLIVARSDLTIWENKMNYFNNYETRLRINEKGHFIQEAKRIFNESIDYRSNEWTTVWSSSPVNHNVTIGISYHIGNSYVLILSDTGVLNLFDAVGALIWCTDIDCKHQFGYQFPEVYLIPTNFITPEVKTDKHNTINTNVSSSSIPYLMSLDYRKQCSSMNSNRAMFSKNNRFKLILENSGNLIIKDGTRTMWESVSGYIEHAVNPYKLILTPSCDLIILSSNGYIVWISLFKYENATGPCKLVLLNEGRLVVTDRNKTEVWQSWPSSNSSGLTILEPIEYRYIPCNGKKPKNIKYLQSEGNNSFLSVNENLISKNGIWDLIFQSHKLVLRKLNTFRFLIAKSINAIDKLVLENNGNITLKDVKNETIWAICFMKTELIDDNKPFTLELSNKGNLFIKNKFNQTIYDFDESKKFIKLTS